MRQLVVAWILMSSLCSGLYFVVKFIPDDPVWFPLCGLIGVVTALVGLFCSKWFWEATGGDEDQPQSFWRV